MRALRRLLAVSMLTALAFGSERVSAEPESPFPLTPTEWLVIQPVDKRARRPFNPDAVFDRYLLERTLGRPQEGDVLTGETGTEQAWRRVHADDEGRLGGPIAWAYARIEMPVARVVIAKLHRGGRLFVNGTGVAGSIYGGGFQGFPVVLRKGANDVFVKGVRGAFKLTFEEAPGPLFVAPWAQTLPDLVEGEPIDTVAGVYVVNAQTKAGGQLRVTIDESDHVRGAEVLTDFVIPPLGVRQVRLPIKGKAGAKVPAGSSLDVLLRLSDAFAPEFQRTGITLKIRKADQPLLRTFVSSIDDSVQTYGVRRPAPAEGETPAMGLVLSLHGAGVNPRGQAGAYSAKPDFWHVCPTNRAPFGFDWQDWGREDAYEVLADALAVSGVSRARVYLTGHSMGGHGAWHLAANDPDGFAAVAPSAGWMSFDSYGGKREPGKLDALWRAADRASDTRALVDNLAQVPAFIVHGTKDDNVPVEQAREMEALLTKAGAPPSVHYAEGKGHWWNGPAAKGTDCVDWPGIFELFRSHVIERAPPKLRFTTVDPGVDASHRWITVWQPLTYGQPSHVEAAPDPDNVGTLLVTSSNVGVLRLEGPSASGPLVIDGKHFPADPVLPRWFERSAGSWSRTTPRAGEKQPRRSGPFKRAFGNRFLFVYPTGGSPQEGRESLDRVLHDASAWAYRANGQTQVVSDRAYLAQRALGKLLDRNVILYGNATTNGAFRILPATCPVVLRAKELRVGSVHRIGTDLGICFVYPDRDGRHLVGVVGSTGIEGDRLGYALLPFVSGVGYPDWVAFDKRILLKGDGGVLGAGWFDARWRLQASGSDAGDDADPPR